ncbi:aminopeptidase P family protein, partial [Mitsuaria sp. TWR114]|uniref:aminopeptidase P family N-terminal domain-containing protein n=1 Tax=Mitsuaria sp. TWR114 TaxID=2601731 RepID=UPI0011C32377
MDTRLSEIKLRIARLRDALRNAGAHAILVPSADPHLSEYLPRRWQAREVLSGFTGSMGTLVVTLDDAQLFADSRYWTQAERELAGSGIALFKIPSGASVQHISWLAERLQPGQTLVVDGQVLGLALAQQLRSAMGAKGVRIDTTRDLIDHAWDERPGLPDAPIYEHAAPQATIGRADKLRQVREAMTRHGVSHHLISSVDDVAWLFNLRGSDVSYNPVFLAHALLDANGATLFVQPGKIDAALA